MRRNSIPIGFFLLFFASLSIGTPLPPASGFYLALVDSEGRPYKAKNGDMLGYSKEESMRRLDPEIRTFLDGILRIYKEVGVFINRKEVFDVLGTELESGEPPQVGSHSPKIKYFRKYAAPKGVFSREGWTADYMYWSSSDLEGAWELQMNIRIPYDRDCIDSRAVEGYLDLYLNSHLDGLAHPLPVRVWYRHGVAGTPVALALSTATPQLTIGFGDGCLGFFRFEGKFNYRDVSDDDIFN